MKKALFLYSTSNSRNSFKKQSLLIIDNLKKKHENLVSIDVNSEKMFIQELKKADNYDVLYFTGGDGTFNVVINILAQFTKKPILGYIPTGTMNDCAKNFGLSKKIKKTLKVLELGKTISFDIGCVNSGEHYFAYFSANGCYSSISYKAKTNIKRRFGKLSYYFLALKEAFKIRKYNYEVEVDGVTYKGQTPFLMLLNSNYAGGFKISNKSKVNDGLFHLYVSKVGLFNGLISYFFTSKRKIQHVGSKFRLSIDSHSSWCFDGESIVEGDINIEILQNNFTIIAN